MIPGKGIYDSLPVWAQNLAVNFASVRNFRDKYGADFHRFLAQLKANERKSRDQLEAEQQQALLALLRYAVTHVPFYREQNLPPDDFAAWPILEKQSIAAAPEKFLSDEFDSHRLMTINTSGTTGTPLTVRFTKEYHQMEMAFRWRHKAWAGCPYLSTGAVSRAILSCPPTSNDRRSGASIASKNACSVHRIISRSTICNGTLTPSGNTRAGFHPRLSIVGLSTGKTDTGPWDLRSPSSRGVYRQRDIA